MNHRGMGRVFQSSYTDKKTGKLRKSARWHIEYWVNGEPHREKTRSAQRADAVKLLKLRTGEAAIGKLLPGDVAKTTFDDLTKLLKQDYKTNDQRTADLEVVLKRLSNSFAGMKATEVTPARIIAYQAEQKKDGYANATINRDLAALKRAFRLGWKQGFVASVPAMDMLKEADPRKGFFEPDEFKAFLKHLPEELQPLFRVAYITGWRVKSELLTRQWQHVDFVHKKLRLDPGEAKSKEPREFPFTDDLKLVLEDQRQRAEKVQKAKNVNVTHVFFRPDGTPIPNYRKAWGAAVTASGIDRIPHDFRRTAVRNLEIAGVPRSVAMKMVGHKTESIYRRYAIVDEGMQQEAAKKLNALHKMQWAKRKPRKGATEKQPSTR